MKTVKLVLLGFFICLDGSIVLAQDSFDSDNDGFDDNSDNCTLTSNPDQRDTDSDGYGNLCDADFNNDQVINSPDLAVLNSRFFTSDPDTDLNGDGAVNFLDLGMLKSRFFTAPGPTGVHPTIPNCNCTFSSDCPSGSFCNYGPGSFLVEDICFWRTPAPPSGPGTGCSTEYEGPWTHLCDGYCTPSLIQ